MVTPKRSECAKTRGAFRRAFSQLGRSLPALARNHWRDVLMPWRLLPQPVALSLIGLVALAMVCSDPAPGTFGEPTLTPEPPAGLSEQAIEIIEDCDNAGGVLDMTTGECVTGATIGGTLVPNYLDCEEDEAIAFVGIPDTLVCVHVEQVGERDAHGCVRPAVFDPDLTHCILPDGTLPCDMGYVLVDERCGPEPTATPERAQ